MEARPLRALLFQEIRLKEPWCARPFPHRCAPTKSEGCEKRRKLLFPGNFRRPLSLWNLLWLVAQLYCAVYRWKLNITTPWPTTATTICNTTKSGQRTGKSSPRFPCWVHRNRSTDPMQSSEVTKRMHGRRFNPFRKYLIFEWPPMTVFIWLITWVCIMTISAASWSKSFMLHTQTIWKFANILDRLDIWFFIGHDGCGHTCTWASLWSHGILVTSIRWLYIFRCNPCRQFKLCHVNTTCSC